MENNAFLGRGWSFPPAFNAEQGSIKMVGDVEDINQSLYILLSTSLGERVMQPNFGANLQDYQFDGLHPALLGFITDIVRTALLLHEPRIEVEKVEVTEPDSFDLIEGTVHISIDYTIRNTNNRYNYVFPFYLNEANQPI